MCVAYGVLLLMELEYDFIIYYINRYYGHSSQS